MVELEVDEIGPSLGYAIVNRRSSQNGGEGFQGNTSPAGQQATPADPPGMPAAQTPNRLL